MIKLCIRKDHNDIERRKNTEVEGRAKNVLAKKIDEELKRIDQVENQVLRVITCVNNGTLEDAVYLHQAAAGDLWKLN